MDRNDTSRPVDFHRITRSMRRVVAVVVESKSPRDLRHPKGFFVLGRFECAPMSMPPEDLKHPDARPLESSIRIRELLLIAEAVDARRNILLLES